MLNTKETNSHQEEGGSSLNNFTHKGKRADCKSRRQRSRLKGKKNGRSQEGKPTVVEKPIPKGSFTPGKG